MLGTVVTFCFVSYAFGGQIVWPEEKHFKNIRQLTFGGENTDAIFSSDGQSILYQGAGIEHYGTRCDAIYKLDLDEPASDQIPQRISSGIGLAIRPHFLADGKQMLYSTTSQTKHYKSEMHNCPMRLCGTDLRKHDQELEKICKSGHTWDLFPEYDVYVVNRFGNGILQLTTAQGYNSDTDISPDGTKIVFTSMRTGDPEIWIMDTDGLNQKQLTYQVGYEGHATFSHDGKKIVFEASRPRTNKQLERYKQLLSYNLISPLEMELFVMNIDGSNITQVTNLGGANLSPYFMKGDNRIIFGSNFESVGHCGDFTIYMIDVDGKNLEKVTGNNGGFDAFPVFDRDQKRILWASSRNGTTFGETNIFIADWVDSDTNKK